MTRRAFRLAIEECLSSLECDLIVRASRRHRCWDRELIEMKRGQFRCQFVRCTAHVSGSAFRGDWILIFVVEASVEECPRGMHLAYADISVPVRNRAEAGPSVQIHAGQTESGRDKGSCLPAIGPKSFAVLVQFRIEAARPPARENLFHSVGIDAEKIGEGLEIWCQ